MQEKMIDPNWQFNYGVEIGTAISPIVKNYIAQGADRGQLTAVTGLTTALTIAMTPLTPTAPTGKRRYTRRSAYWNRKQRG